MSNLTEIPLYSEYYKLTESLDLVQNHHDLETSYPSKLVDEECVEAMKPT